ncbi:MAG: helix-turn-helix transcriptional regulator, partial [Hyphomicrobiales bacterium]|nr:helix-turn-helix transcriptional regulator [Hyphomicrobiales bacterium]
MDAEILEQETGRRYDGGAKRRQIMDGARTVFLSAGFDGASMNDIARAAGVSKGTLYAYFTSKEELFEAIIRA